MYNELGLWTVWVVVSNRFGLSLTPFPGEKQLAKELCTLSADNMALLQGVVLDFVYVFALEMGFLASETPPPGMKA